MKETVRKKKFILSAFSYKKACRSKSIFIFCTENFRQDKHSQIVFKTSDYPPHYSLAINTSKSNRRENLH